MAIEYVDNLDPVWINVKRGIWAFPAINSAHYKQNDKDLLCIMSKEYSYITTVLFCPLFFLHFSFSFGI